MSGADLPLLRCDEQRASLALDLLRSSHPRASSVVDALERAVQDRRVSEDTFVQHSRWCNTEGSWAAGVNPAREAALAMYGFVPERLKGGDGSTDAEMRRLLAEYRKRLREL